MPNKIYVSEIIEEIIEKESGKLAKRVIEDMINVTTETIIRNKQEIKNYENKIKMLGKNIKEDEEHLKILQGIL